MTTRVDVLICGAGPAGTAAALAARRADPSASVVLVDRAAFPRDKVCGDGIGPHAGDALAELGVAEVVRDHERFAAYRMRGPGGVEVTADSARTGWVVPRYDFDARLLDAAAGSGADLERHRVRSVAVHTDGVTVDDTYTAGVLIAADGANSVVRRALGAGPNAPAFRAMALRGYAPRPPGLDEIYFAWDGSSGLAYTWAFPTADERVNVGYIRLASAGAGRRQLEQALAARLPHLAPAPGTIGGHTLPLSSRRPDPAPHPRVLLVGDAASLINPLSGEGIYYALISGARAGAAAVTCADPGAAYRATLRARFARHWRHARLMAATLHVPGSVATGLRAARHEPELLESLIAVALGDGTLSGRGAARVASGLLRRALTWPARVG